MRILEIIHANEANACMVRLDLLLHKYNCRLVRLLVHRLKFCIRGEIIKQQAASIVTWPRQTNLIS